MNIFMTSTSRSGEYTCQLAAALSEKHRVSIALDALNHSSMIKDFPVFFNQSRMSCMPVARSRIWRPEKYVSAVKLFKSILKENPDVIHDQNCHRTENFIALTLAKFMGYPIVLTIHDALPHPGDKYSNIIKFIVSQNLYMADQVIVHGNHIKEALIHQFSLDERLINVVPHGNYDIYHHALSRSDFSDIRRKKDMTDEKRVLLIGRMVRYKGLEVLIKAAPQLLKSAPDTKIVVAGSGPELNRLESSIKDLPYFEIINKRLTSKEFARQAAGADVLVLPYLEASQSGPLNIAFSFKKPVVASSVGSISEVLDHEQEGLIVPPNDPDALARALARLVNSAEERERMGQKGGEKAAGVLAWNGGIADDTIHVYKKAVEMKKKGISYHRRSRVAYFYLFKEIFH